MGRTRSIITLLVLVALVGVPLGAQAQAPAPMSPSSRDNLRRQIYMMEGALVGAVQFGAQQLNREIRTISPEIIVLAGNAHARGVYLEGHGVHFDVGVPIMLQSAFWSLKTMYDRQDATLQDSLSFLRALIKATNDPAQRSLLQYALSRLEGGGSLGPPPQERRAASSPTRAVNQGAVGAAMVPPDKDAATPPSNPLTAAAPAPAPAASGPSSVETSVLQDPGRAYTEAVQNALIEAMLDYSPPMELAAEEFLTVAARDNEPRDSVAPRDPYEEVITVLLRVRGADLAAFRKGAIDREEMRRRVQITQF